MEDATVSLDTFFTTHDDGTRSMSFTFNDIPPRAPSPLNDVAVGIIINMAKAFPSDAWDEMLERMGAVPK